MWFLAHLAPEHGSHNGPQLFQFKIGSFGYMVKDSPVGRDFAPHNDSIVGNHIVLPYTALDINTGSKSVSIYGEIFGN